MSDIKKIIAPFTISASNVQGGYLTDLQSKFRSGIEIINYHEDRIGEVESAPAQSPFTQQWVGGNQHRHIDFSNDATDRANNRPEAWHLIPNLSSIRLYSHKALNSPPAYWTREEAAKRPINIKNIVSTTSSINLGNFRQNYEVVQISGRISNSFLKNVLTGTETAGTLRTRFVAANASGSLTFNQLLDNTRKSSAILDSQRNKTVFVSRFNAPGEINTSTRVSMDVESEEISPNNPTNYRNIGPRANLRSILSQSQSQFNLNAASHGVNRNNLPTLTGKVSKDNFFVQHPIPRTDIQYAWISSSAITKAIDMGGYESFGTNYNRGETFDDITFKGSTGDILLQNNRREFGTNLATNTFGKIDLLDLSPFQNAQKLTGSTSGFIANGESEIRIDTGNGERWFIFAGALPRFLQLSKRFTAPIVLSLEWLVADFTPVSLGSLNCADNNENLDVQVSYDDTRTWTTIGTVVRGTSLSPTNQRGRTNFAVPFNGQPYYVKLVQTVANSAPVSDVIPIYNLQAYYNPLSASNSDYGFGTWKQIRGNETNVSRALRANNLISVADISQEKTRKIGGREVIASKRSDSVSNFTETPVSSKYKPLKHMFIFKGNSNPHLGHEVIHTYNNNLSMFANKDLNNKLGVEEIRDQVYNRLLEFYSDPNKSEDDNPIAKFIGYETSEVIYPKEENTGLAKTRGRIKYILNKPGFDRDGYDRQFGTQRVFWRDNYFDRMRSASGSINSQNQFIGLMNITSTFHDNFVGSYAGYEGPWAYSSYMSSSYYNLGQNSVLPIENLKAYNMILTASLIHTGGTGGGGTGGPVTSSQKMYTWENAGELNNLNWIDIFGGSGGLFAAPAGKPDHLIRNDDMWLYNLQTNARLIDLQQQPGGINPASTWNALPYTWYMENSSSIFPKPRIGYTAFLGGYEIGTRTGQDPFAVQPTGNLTSSLDFGLSYVADQMSGKKPWFDSYEKYVDDIRGAAKNYSILPEFRVSEHMPYYVSQSGGNFREKNSAFLSIDGIGSEYRSSLTETDFYNNTFFKTYINSDTSKNSDILRKQNKKITSLDKISFKISGIKKLLPYNGFYPINRTIQIANLYSKYIDENFAGGYLITPKQVLDGAPTTRAGFIVDTPLADAARKQSALEPLFGPGILFNTIKSGIAVDWPAITASYDVNSYTALDFPQWAYIENKPVPLSYRPRLSMRMPFETILEPKQGFSIKPQITSSMQILFDTTFGANILKDSYLYGHFSTSAHSFMPQGNDDQDWIGSIPFSYIKNNSTQVPLYQMSINNFLAETVRFFLKDEKMNAFVSEDESKWKIFDSTKVYSMDLVLRKDESLVMIEAFTSSFTPAGIISNTKYNSKTAHGRYFGYPTDTNVHDKLMHNDPAYAPYTPPYFEGEAILRIKFAPPTTGKYTLDQIFQQVTVEDIFNDLANKLDRNSVAFQNKMSVQASLNVFGQTRKNEVEFNPRNRNVASLVKESVDTTRNTWIIGPKLETPVLDFSSQPIVQMTGPHWVGAGFGRGMWSGYGNIPTGQKGIHLELRESFPTKLLQKGSISGSLLQQVGFRPSKKKIGQLAQTKEISEAIVVIPYLDMSQRGITENINGINVIGIRKAIFEVQKQNIENGDPAIKVGNLGSKEEIRETSISQTISKMPNYVIPPQFNFLEYADINPFVMYLFEFKHILDRQDLADIWQGLMPKIATTAELDEAEISHKTGMYEFFHGEELPENIRWMVFKVKKKAEKNYYAVTADSSDDDRFKFDFQIGRKEPEYSYNWPYDYFSLVEFAKVELTLDYKNRNTEDKLTQGQTANFTKNLLGEVSKKRGRKKK